MSGVAWPPPVMHTARGRTAVPVMIGHDDTPHDDDLSDVGVFLDLV